jgi:gluconolactonase
MRQSEPVPPARRDEEVDPMIESDDGLSALIVSAEPERICTGHIFTEGPVWVPADDCLLFSDIPAHRIYRWRPGKSEAEVYRAESGYANGLTLDHDGNLLACEHRNRRVSRSPYGGEVDRVIDRFEGNRFNSPNDVVVGNDGAIWFTDPTYGMDKPEEGSLGDPQECDCQGVYRVAPDGSITCVVDDFTQPNGLAFSPDQSHLYINDSHENVVRRFAVGADGTLTGGGLFADMRGDPRPGCADGMKVDEEGRIWSTGPGGVWVLAPDGTLLGVLRIPEVTANCAFGGRGFSTLFVTATSSVYRVETTVRGVAPGSR